MIRGVNVIAFAILVLTIEPSSAASISQSVARQEVVAFLDNLAHFDVYLGKFQIITSAPPFNGRANPEQGTLGEGLLQIYKTYAAVGIVSVLAEKPLANQNFSWGNLLDQTTGGVTQIVTVSATPAGRTFAGQCGARNCLHLPQGKHSIDSIVRLDNQNIGADDYAIVFARTTMQYNSIQLRYLDILKIRHESTRQDDYKILFKYDPFNDKWEEIAYDWANKGREFTSNNVSNAIVRLRGG